ncbi:hypothetical protein ABZP36_030237 [Zizania latifolia]
MISNHECVNKKFKGSPPRALVSEKPAEPAPAKREAWKGFGWEVSNGDDEVQMQGESASWNVLNQIGVEINITPKAAQKELAAQSTVDKELVSRDELLEGKHFVTPGNPASVLYVKNLAKDVIHDDFYHVFGESN